MTRVNAADSPNLWWAITSGISQIDGTLSAFLSTPVTFRDLLADNFAERCATAINWQQLDDLLAEAKALQAQHGADVLLSADLGANQFLDHSVADLIANLQSLHDIAAPLRAVGKKRAKV
jgi:hypothetical protein